MMWRAGIMLVCLTVPAFAEAPQSSLFPQPRPVGNTTATANADAETFPAPTETTVPAAAVDAAAQAALDAVTEAALATEAATEAEAGAATGALAASLFPRARPGGNVSADDTAETDQAPRGNGICGNPALTGQSIPRVRSRTNGCGVEEPVQITAVDGIALSIPSTMDCTTANPLAAWVDQGLRPAFGNDRVVGLQVAGHYICRSRNNVRGARISEHGRGKAIDISGIILADGRVLTVANNWNRQMRTAYQAACGIFGTTLGPGSDGYHEDHMHFDTASHRNGPYCR